MADETMSGKGVGGGVAPDDEGLGLGEVAGAVLLGGGLLGGVLVGRVEGLADGALGGMYAGAV